MAQSFSVTGKVKNKTTGESFVGATVTIDGTSKSTVTNNEGNFTISASKGITLVITFSGMTPVRYQVMNSGFIEIQMEEASKSLNEVVVIGYGTKKRKELSTAISSISAKEITATPVADAAQALQGKVSGVTIVQGSGAPGGTGGTGIKIRGISSLTGTNNPLIVVDGYPLPDQGADNILNSFGTGDIESIDVLKDAAAASIYGVRASNGVIMITTKRGRAGRTSLSVDIYRGVQNAWSLPNLLNPREYAIINSEARIASGLPVIPKLADFESIGQQYGNGTDWLDLIFRRAAMQSVNITASGGSDKSQYSFSAGYFKQDGIIYKTDFERYNLRFNGDIKVNNFIKIGNSLSMNQSIQHGADTYSAFNSVVLLALTSPPTVKPRNVDGTYAGGDGNDDGFAEPNPIYQLEVPKNNTDKYRITGNVYAEINLMKELKFKAVFGGDFTYVEGNSFSVATPSSGGRPITTTGYSESKGLYKDFLSEYTLTYDKIFREKHKVNAVAGYTFQENKFSELFASRGNGIFAQNIPVLNDIIFRPGNITQIGNYSNYGTNLRLLSYFGRLNYDYDGRGFLSFSIRRDGSSNFAPQNKFAIFPSVSAGWRLSEEPFLEKIGWLDELKLRGSFGYTGNPNVAANAYLQTINQSFQYTFGNSGSSGGIVGAVAPSGSFNPNIKWEKNEQFDIGIDGSIYKNRFGFSVDVYQRRSKDLILYVAPPYLSGTYEAVPFNTGTLQNRGIDLSLTGKIITSKAIRWNANAVISTYQNKVISLGLSAPLNNEFTNIRITGGSLRTIQGSPAAFFYGFVTEGIFQDYGEIAKHAKQTQGSDPTTSTAPGDIKFKDLNNDGIINNEDRTNIGNANPTFTFGLTNTFTYKNFELNIFLQGSQGNKVLNFTRWYTEGGVSNGNYSNNVIGRWTAPGTSNSMPRVTLNDPNGNNRVSDRFVEDASYIRVKNVRLSYNLPSKWADRLKMKKTQFYVSAQNLFTFTNYSGLDPEIGGAIDLGFYPQARTFIGGITIDF
jgi:TonB-linked SusC/RagA family outer membrane protein